MGSPSYLPQQQVSDCFLTSPEYCQHFGYTPPASCPDQFGQSVPPTDSGFLNLLFSNAYARSPTSGESAAWASTARPAVVDYILGSSEFNADYGAYASTYCAGYTTPQSVSPASITLSQQATVTLTYTNTACGGQDMGTGSLFINPPGGPNYNTGCYASWSYDPATHALFAQSWEPTICTVTPVGLSWSGTTAYVALNVTVLAASLLGSQDLYTEAVDQHLAGTRTPMDLCSSPGCFTVQTSAAPMVTLVNTGRGGSLFYVGDNWTITIAGPPNQPVTLNYTFNGSGANGLSYGTTNASGVLTLTGTDVAANVGAWIEQWFVGGVAASPALSFSVFPVPTVQLTVDPYTGTTFQVGDAYTVLITGQPSQPVTVTQNGSNYQMGSTNTQGTELLGGTWGTAGNYTQTWYVGGVAANPPLSFSVVPTPGSNQPNSFTAGNNPLTCNDVTGTWEDTLPGVSAEWSLTMSDATHVQGTLSRQVYQGCSDLTNYSVSGTLSGTTFTLDATQSIEQNACGLLATSITETITFPAAPAAQHQPSGLHRTTLVITAVMCRPGKPRRSTTTSRSRHTYR